MCEYEYYAKKIQILAYKAKSDIDDVLKHAETQERTVQDYMLVFLNRDTEEADENDVLAVNAETNKLLSPAVRSDMQ